MDDVTFLLDLPVVLFIPRSAQMLSTAERARVRMREPRRAARVTRTSFWTSRRDCLKMAACGWKEG